jgi:pimeloyl-ACP methyl ester carboxylesterase
LRRAGWLALALLLILPAVGPAARVFLSAAFLAEFFSDGRWRLLSAATPAPSVTPLDGPGRPDLVADLYVRPTFARPPGLVLVHGIAIRGKDDARLRRAAALFARAGWAVAVPTIGGLTKLRLRPDDAAAVVAAVRALDGAGFRPVALVGVSLGAAPALLAAADPSVSRSISAVLSLGGYASALELLRYTLTGAYQFRGIAGRHPVDERAIAQFAEANPELVDPAGRRLIGNRDPADFDRIAAELPPRTRQLLAELSPEHALPRIEAPMFLVHGRDDPAVPFTESLRLEEIGRAAGRRVSIAIAGAVVHVEPGSPGGVRDLLGLWAAFYGFLTAAHASP